MPQGSKDFKVWTMFRNWIFVTLIFLSHTLYGQGFNVSGQIMDETDTTGLIGVSIVLTSTSDTSVKSGTVTDVDGNFLLNNVAPGQYQLRGTYVGFEPYTRTINVVNEDVQLGRFQLKISETTLQNVVVQSTQIRTQQLGDTTQFNANAFKTNPDANAEDLMKKMPGITSENGTLKANGEDVKRVFVDGKEFFGTDPNAAIKNLPAEIIDKIQVFDRQSDQSRFTGFDDGETEKTINIVTKSGKNTGQFGKIYGGYGTDDRYTAGGNVNFFNGKQRISLIGLSNNINQQNFSSEDLLGVFESSGGRSRGGSGGPRGGGRGSRGSDGGSRGGSRGGSDASSFLVGQQGGITQTNSVGLNYSDEWGKKIKVSGSYFFNATENGNNTRLTRTPNVDSGLSYNETSTTNTVNQNHRFNFRMEYDIDSSNSLVITPRLSLQNNQYRKDLLGGSYVIEGVPDSRIVNNNSAANTGYNFSNDILYRHKFAKKGRSVSLNLGTQFNNRTGNGEIYSLNEYLLFDTTLLDQKYDLASDGYTLSGNLRYTEPLGQKSMLMFNYAPSYNENNSDKSTYNFSNAEQEYSDLDTLLSNKFSNTYTTHRGGVNYRFNDKTYSLSLGVNGQYAVLDGQQQFPYAFNLQRTFWNILPQAMFNYRFEKTKNLRLMYRANTTAPSISQLQNAIDNSNPLLLSTGNPNLNQSYGHSLSLRYGATNTTTARSFFAFINGTYTNDYIANATYFATGDTLLIDGITVPSGGQLTRPVNLDGYYNLRTFITYGIPVNPIKSNLNLNAGFTYNHAPSLINNATNISNTYNFNGGLVLSSNISENVDFTLSYSGNYNIVKNTLQAQSDNSYYIQNTALRFNWLFLDGFVFSTDLNHNLYSGLNNSFNQNFLLWNASVGYKLLKSKALDIRLSAYDILNQNRAISRDVTETYIEDSYTDVLQRYFMLTATYTLRNFKK